MSSAGDRPVPFRVLVALALGVFAAGMVVSEALDPRWIAPRPTRIPVQTVVAVTLADRPLPTQRPSRSPTSSMTTAAGPTGIDEPISKSDPAESGEALAVVVDTEGRGVRLRASPGSQGATLAVLQEGSTVELNGPSAEVEGRQWLEVRDSDGQIGWVAAAFLATVGGGR